MRQRGSTSLGSSQRRPPALGINTTTTTAAAQEPLQVFGASPSNKASSKNIAIREEALDLFQALGGEVVDASKSPSHRAEGCGTIKLQTMVTLFRTFHLSREVLETTLPTLSGGHSYSVHDEESESATLDFEDFLRFYRTLLKQKSTTVGFGVGSSYVAHNNRDSTNIPTPSVNLAATTTLLLPQLATTTGSSGDTKQQTTTAAAAALNLGLISDDDDDEILSPRSEMDDDVDQLDSARSGASVRQALGGGDRPARVSKSFRRKMSTGSSVNLNRVDRSRSIADFLNGEAEALDGPGSPWGALSRMVSAVETDMPSAADQNPVLQKAMAYGGIGATRQTKNTKFSKTIQEILFPPARRVGKHFTTDEVSAVVLLQEEARGMSTYKRGTRKPKSSVAFAGLHTFPKVSTSIGVTASGGGDKQQGGATRSLSPEDSSEEGGGNNNSRSHRRPLLPRSTGSSPLGSSYAKPKQRAGGVSSIKRPPPVWKSPDRNSGALPPVRDVYKQNARATPLDRLAQTPTFQLPMADKMMMSRGVPQLGVGGGGALGKGGGVGGGSPDSRTNPFHNLHLQSLAQRTLSLMQPLPQSLY